MEDAVTCESGGGENKENKNIAVENPADITPKIDTTGNTDLPSTSTQKEVNESNPDVKFIVVYNKNKYDIAFNSNQTIMELKKYLEKLINIPYEYQKIMVKGLAKNEQTLKDLAVKNGSKVMVIGSPVETIRSIASSSSESVVSEEKQSVPKEPLCKQKMHSKIIEKGVPDDVMVGIKFVKDRLPSTPLVGMVNKHNAKVRLTFKLELDQLWISTKERTEKLSMTSIKDVVSESIVGHEQYHIMGLQLGSSAASRYWVYWVPAQYVDAIKSAILGSVLLF